MTMLPRLLLVIPHLGGGGAERVTAQLARHLNPELFEIHLAVITSDCPGAQLPPASVSLHRLNAGRVRNAWLPLLCLIRSLKPRVILSSMAHLNFLILLLKPLLPGHTRILVRQNTTTSASNPSWITRQLYRQLYPRAAAILCQSQAMADDLAKRFGVAPHLLHCLSNPIDIESIHGNASHPVIWCEDAAPRLLTVGRLSREKGMDLLLHATAILRKTYPDVQLAILGRGSEEASLRVLAAELGLNTSVVFAGHTDPALYYPGATLYVLPSRHEGMPNSLLEAAAAGLPLVVTPCSQGVIELLQEAPGAWIASHISAEPLAETIGRALGTTAVQSPRYQHAFLAPFELQSAIAAYEGLILRFVNEDRT